MIDCLFIFLIEHNFLIRVYETIYTNFIFHPLSQTNEFFIYPFFHPPNQTHMKENYIFFILVLFYLFFIFFSFHFSTIPTRPLKSTCVTTIIDILGQIIKAQAQLCLVCKQTDSCSASLLTIVNVELSPL